MTISNKLKAKAESFRSLHHKPTCFILPNAWDVISAKIFESLGFSAIGTTSAGISASLGYPDGEFMSLDENMEVVHRISQSTDIPVSADIERGYSESIEGVVHASQAVMDAGAVGLNLEDSTGDDSNPLFKISNMTEKIRAIRKNAEKCGVPLVINLRTDVYLVRDVDEVSRFHSAVERGNAYAEAGADCIFIPDMGDLDIDTIRNLVREIDAPINIIACKNTPPVAELEEISVRRVSVGPRPMRALLALLQKMGREWSDGHFDSLGMDALSYDEVNRLCSNEPV